MVVLVVGPESSGTKAVSTLLRHAGASVIHRSLPYGGDRPHHPTWPDLTDELEMADSIVAVTRDLYATMRSQIDTGHVDTAEQALANISVAWGIIGDLAAGTHRFLPVTFESLQRQEAVTELLHQLGLSAGQPALADANAKWYGGEWFRDQRPAEDR